MEEYKKCSKCNKNLYITKFVKSKNRQGNSTRRSYCYNCKWLAEKPTINKERRAKNYKAYYDKHWKLAVYKTYSWVDKSKGHENTITKNEFEALVKLPCYYCEVVPSGGLDRIENSLGHNLQNVRPCCEKCNNILGDLPDEAKLILKLPLKQIKEKGLLREWVIPTKRKKKLQHHGVELDTLPIKEATPED